MMKWRLAILQGEYGEKYSKRLTYRKIAEDTGLSKTTVSDIALGKIKRPDADTMNALLSYLSEKLERPLTTDDLWRFVPDKQGE